MNLGCFTGIIIEPAKPTLSIISFFIVLVTLFILKKTKMSTTLKISIIYAHLTALIFPFVLYSTHLGCGATCMSCYTNTLTLVSIALPTTIFLSTLAGLFIIPSLYMFSNRKLIIKNKNILNFVEKKSKKMGIKSPKIYAIDSSRPIAFSFRSFISAIFMSIGIFDILNKKEIESVVLHELYHIKQNSSIIKFSNIIIRLFSPLALLANFNHDINKEEINADRFVIKEQKTSKYLKSAKKKINKYNKFFI